MDRKKRIRQLNDLFRETGIGGIVALTPGVQTLPEDAWNTLYSLVRRFNRFAEDNDPHNEHNHGSVKYEGETYFWKIDYYDKSLRCGSEDPADPAQTMRVLTIMQACEY